VSIAITSDTSVCGAGSLSDGTHTIAAQPPAASQTQTFTLPALPSGANYTASWNFASDSLCVCSYNGGTSSNAGTIASGTIGGVGVSYTITCSELIP
jgi:hypothetical protein